MPESRGMAVVRSGDTSILFRAALFDGAGSPITTTAVLNILHVVPTTGAIETYDFNNNTFTAGAVTTFGANMTHRQANNNTVDTGIHTYRHTSLGAFTVGDKYFARVTHASLPQPVIAEFQYGDLEGDEATLIPDFVWDENITGHVAANSAGGALDALGTAIDGRSNNANLNALLGVTDAASTNLSDMIWDENIVSAHGSASTAGLLLRVLGAAISTRANNATLNAVLGVPDVASNTIANTIWDALLASHVTASTMGAVMNAIAASGAPSAATIADAVWDEDIVGAHGTASTGGLLLRVLGAAISTRANNATLNALLGVADSSGVDVPSTVTDEVWDEDIVGAHGTASTGGLLLRVLGAAISTRANNATLNALLGVTDAASTNLSDMVWDEVLNAGHVVSDSAAQRLKAIDDLTQAGGAGDLAAALIQALKIDASAADSPATAGSIARKLDDLAVAVAELDYQLLCSLNIQASSLHIEAAIERSGVIQTSPWVDCVAQIFDEDGGIVHTVGAGDFGAIGARGVFMVDIASHALVSGKSYQIEVTITDGASETFQSTKLFRVAQI